MLQSLPAFDAVYQVGGAQGVAALAYGTETIPKVDKIVGPGNIYVATAKRQVFGQVDIDMIAGPSEIGVIADDSANPVHLAADLLSQAEHDPRARAIMVTTSESLANAVSDEVERQLKLLPRESIARPAIENNSYIAIMDSIEDMFTVMNEDGSRAFGNPIARSNELHEPRSKCRLRIPRCLCV